MASWVLLCRNCRVLFEHSKIATERLADWQLPTKPKLPAGGAEFQCPNCAHVAKYERTDLTYKV
jgi:hypothetical protein